MARIMMYVFALYLISHKIVLSVAVIPTILYLEYRNWEANQENK